MEVNSKNRLNKSVLYTFGFADFGFHLMVSMETMFFAAFLTDYAKFPLIVAGIILNITSIIDIIAAPTAGVILEKSNFKFGGKYRSWILLAPPIVAIFYILQFTKIGSSNMAALIICTGFVISHLVWNAMSSAHISLLGKITNIPDERTMLSANRVQWQSLATLLFSYMAMPLVTFIGLKTTPVLGYTYAVAVFATVMVIAYWYVYYLTRGKDPYDNNSKVGQETSTIDMIKLVIKNPPLLCLLVAECFKNTFYLLLLGFAFYYFKYVLNNIAFLPVYLLVTNIASLFGSILGGKIAIKLGKKKTYIYGILALVLCLVMAKFMGTTSWMFTIIISAGIFFLRISTTVTTALYSDTVVYGEYKTKINTRGFIMSLVGLPIKVGVFIRSFILTTGLAAIGFVADGAVTDKVVNGISNFMTLLPALIALLCVVILFVGFKINESNVISMQEEISKRS